MAINLERELFALQVDSLLIKSEDRILRKLRPLIAAAIYGIERMVTAGQVVTAADIERVLIPLNDALAAALAEEMEGNQPELRNLAASWADVTPLAPLQSGSTLMRQAEMDGKSMAAWFKRASPSPWMSSLIATVTKAVDQGWERHREATTQALTRAVTTAAETGLFSNANQGLMANWTARELVWHTRQDELVCPICAPKQGTVYSGASNGPPSASHPRCRCVGVAARGEVIT